jgi:hypothetical protein
VAERIEILFWVDFVLIHDWIICDLGGLEQGWGLANFVLRDIMCKLLQDRKRILKTCFLKVTIQI